MTNEELNTALYKKMFAEQEAYKEWLLVQPAEEILRNAYEYVMREDILLSLENNDLSDRYATMLLKMDKPLAAVFNKLEHTESPHMEHVWECVQQCAYDAIEAEKVKDLPIYPHSAAYARDHGELAAYRESYQINIDCSKAIDTAIRTNYRNNRLDQAAVNQVVERFGMDRTLMVLAATARYKDRDGRIDDSHKAWAQTVAVPDDRDASGADRTHALLDQPLTQELVDYLCEKATSTKHWPELRFEHLRILLLNQSSHNFDLKEWYFNSWKRSRRLWLRMYYLRGYAMYATESEMEAEMKRFVDLLRKNHDYQDYEDIISCAGLPYLAREYGYACFHRALAVAREEYEKIDALLRDRWTTNEKLERVNLLSNAETLAREKAFLFKLQSEAAETAWPAAMQCDNGGIHQDAIRLEPGRLYSITIGCAVFREDIPTVPTLSVTEGSGGYIQFDTSRYPAPLQMANKKSTRISARLNTKTQAPFVLYTEDGTLNVTFQSWVLSADGKSGAWHESTALPALSMQREQISHNKIRYGCNAAGHPEEFDCFVFTVEWKPLQKKG